MDKQTKSRIRMTLIVALLLALVAAACASDDDGGGSDTTVSATFTPATTVPLRGAVGGTNGSDARQAVGAPEFGDGGVVPVALQAVDIGRDIIFRAELTVAVNDVAAATREATARIQSLGGFVSGQQSSDSGSALSVLTFKVFPEDFQKALDRLGSIGELRSQIVSSDDVTERIVDLESRINTAAASVERIRALLDDAGDIKTIVEIENQLLQRETQLETLRGQLRTLEDAVGLATITVTITESEARPDLAFAMSAYPGHEDAGQSCPGRSNSLTVDEGEAYTMCFTIVNSGDVPLADVTLADSILGVALSDLLVVEGSVAEPLEPGERLLLAGEFTADSDVRSRTRVAATPLDKDGSPIPGRVAAATEAFFVDSVDPGGIASFSDGFAGSVEVLRTLGAILVLLAGIALPLIWLIPILVYGRRWWMRRHEAGESEAATA